MVGSGGAAGRGSAPSRRRGAHAPGVRGGSARSSRAGRTPPAWRPREVGPREVRRYVAGSRRRGAAPASTARKLAAVRALFSSQREHGLIAGNPADLVATPRRPSRLPRVLKASEVARLLESIVGPPTRHPRSPPSRPAHPDVQDPAPPAWGCATGRCSSWRTRAGCGRRSSCRWGRGRRLGRRAAARGGQGPQDAVRAGRGGGARGAARLPGAGARSGGGERNRRTERVGGQLFLSKSGRRLSTSDVRRRLRRVDGARGRGRVEPPRTPCATASRRTCWTAARTCGASRSCSATPASRPRRFTLG